MNKERGIIGLVIMLIVALVLAKYVFNFSIFDAAATPQGQQTQSYMHQVFATVWSYVSAPIIFIWSQLIWPFFAFLGRILKPLLDWGQNSLSNSVPTLPGDK